MVLRIIFVSCLMQIASLCIVFIVGYVVLTQLVLPHSGEIAVWIVQQALAQMAHSTQNQSIPSLLRLFHMGG